MFFSYFFNMVEVGGFEPPSPDLNLEDTTCLTYLLSLAVRISDKRDTQTASFQKFRSVPESGGCGTILHTGAASGLPGNRPEGSP